MTIGSNDPDVCPSPEAVAKAGSNRFQMFEKLALNQRIEPQNFLEKWAKIDTFNV
jgi:hypothetical protein